MPTLRNLHVRLIAFIAVATSGGAVLAGDIDLSRIRIDFDPVTRLPFCTVVSPDPRIMGVLPVPCPTDNRTPGVNTPPGGTTNTNISTGTPDSHDSAPSPVIIAGALNGGVNAFSVLRFANFGSTSGIARVTIVDPANGQTLGVWMSPQLPPRSSMQTDVATVASAATATSSGTVIPATLNLQISASFRGSVQHLIGAGPDGSLTNASACGPAVIAPRERLAFVARDTATSRSWVRIVNGGKAAATTSLIVRDAGTGTSAGSWTSSSIAVGGSVVISLATLRDEAAVASTIGAVMIDTDQLAEGLRLELMATVTSAGTIADQTTSCSL